MAKKITYLFGAGASYNALPLVKTVPNRMGNFLSVLKRNDFQLEDSTPDDFPLKISKRDCQIKLIEDLEWLQKQSRQHASIDTFAKKLMIKGDRHGTKKLKIALSIYFAFEQIRMPVDYRYDAFFASILNSITNFPDHIRVLSWNYDAQFELAISEYINHSDLESSELWLRVRNKFEQKETEPGFGIFKLNGTASCFVKQDYGLQKSWLLDNNKKEFTIEILDNLIYQYAYASLNSLNPFFSFSWEKNNKILAEAKTETKDTEVLIVIGYSFPFFNRQIDRDLIRNMGLNLRKVYFQSPEANKLIQRFQAIKENIMKPELIPMADDLDQFFLPPEL